MCFSVSICVRPSITALALPPAQRQPSWRNLWKSYADTFNSLERDLQRRRRARSRGKCCDSTPTVLHRRLDLLFSVVSPQYPAPASLTDCLVKLAFHRIKCHNGSHQHRRKEPLSQWLEWLDKIAAMIIIDSHGYGLCSDDTKWHLGKKWILGSPQHIGLLGGTLADGSPGSDTLADGSLSSSSLADSSLRSASVAGGSLADGSLGGCSPADGLFGSSSQLDGSRLGILQLGDSQPDQS